MRAALPEHQHQDRLPGAGRLRPPACEAAEPAAPRQGDARAAHRHPPAGGGDGHVAAAAAAPPRGQHERRCRDDEQSVSVADRHDQVRRAPGQGTGHRGGVQGAGVPGRGTGGRCTIVSKLFSLDVGSEQSMQLT